LPRRAARALGNKAPFGELRQLLYSLSDIKMGHNVKISSGTMIGRSVRIGDDARIGANVLVVNSTIGDNSFIDFGAVLVGTEGNHIEIGKQTYVGIYTVMDGSGGLKIGDHVQIGSNVGMWTHSSIYECLLGEPLEKHKKLILAPIKIENNVWIGGNSTIYPDTKIGHHSAILPNTVVNKDIPPYSMAGGTPAKIIRKINIKNDKVKLINVDDEAA
jgi:acetyltransferase-like isoleucine patch superfamily enzyme